MKRVRFHAYGIDHHGQLTEAGELLSADGSIYASDAVTWLPPTVPTKVLGLALNYAEHAHELKLDAPPEPALFFKPVSALIGHNQPVIYPAGVKFMHYEVELAVVIGRRCRRVPQRKAYDVIAGYTIANDVTVRDYVANFYRPPVRAKGYDTFGPVGPYLVTPDEVQDPGQLELRAYVNGELRQKGNTSQMILSIPELVEYISNVMTLEPGDMIWTGTPKGISHVYPGDVMRLEIDGLGVLQNEVAAESESETLNDRDD
ncbi:MAG TPA: fumarylacetoacetate hydrolase family protein [Anaerolineales bacterium]|nr:fumarylacetoacetate hydrolase family protein [Anaerolineales bacterium]